MKKIIDSRFIQANREARWSIWLTLFYMLCWFLTAYFPDSQQGITGLPHWFELSCLFLPPLFVFLCWLMVKLKFKNIPLDDNNAD